MWKNNFGVIIITFISGIFLYNYNYFINTHFVYKFNSENKASEIYNRLQSLKQGRQDDVYPTTLSSLSTANDGKGLLLHRPWGQPFPFIFYNASEIMWISKGLR